VRNCKGGDFGERGRVGDRIGDGERAWDGDGGGFGDGGDGAPPAMRSFTFLRLCDSLMEDDNFAAFEAFVRDMNSDD